VTIHIHILQLVIVSSVVDHIAVGVGVVGPHHLAYRLAGDDRVVDQGIWTPRPALIGAAV
jgi:hypothetical protein